MSRIRRELPANGRGTKMPLILPMETRGGFLPETVAVAVTVIIPRQRARFNSFSLKGPGIMSGSAESNWQRA